MARRRKEAVADESLKRRRRQLKGRERRESKRTQREDTAAAGPIDTTWLRTIKTVSQAEKILSRYRARPYWLSIPYEGNPPVAEYLPCNLFRRHDRVYYGFLFREHREMAFNLFTDARRELTSTIDAFAPQLVRG